MTRGTTDIFILMVMSVSTSGPSDSIHDLAPTKGRLSEHALLLLRISAIRLRCTPSLLPLLRSHALAHQISILLETAIVYKTVASVLAGSDAWWCDGSRSRFQDVVRVVVDLIRRFFYLFHLHVQLIRQLLQLPTRIRRHQRWICRLSLVLGEGM